MKTTAARQQPSNVQTKSARNGRITSSGMRGPAEVTAHGETEHGSQIQTAAKVHATLNNSPQVEGAAKLHATLNRSPQVQAAAKLQARIKKNAPASPLQLHEDPASIHQAARMGVSGHGGKLPFGDTIQKSFGHHDISPIQAFTDSNAAAASQAIGAQAYTMNDKVAFGATPSLALAAHEAAHFVQQQSGVHLKSGIGHAGDHYEQQADAAADAVIRGESAEAILDNQRGSGQTAASSEPDAPVQRKLLTKKQNEEQAKEVTPPQLKPLVSDKIDQMAYSYLSLLSSADEEYVFDLNENGKTTRAAVEEKIAIYLKNSNAFNASHNPNLWSFTLPKNKTADWRLKSEAGIKLDGLENGDWNITIDLTHFRHLTETAREAFMTALGRGPVPKLDAMVLSTDLDYDEWHPGGGLLRKIGVLGGTLLTVSVIQSPSANGPLFAMRASVFQQWRVLEIDQDDLRHIGTHDHDNPGILNHFHVVKYAGTEWTDTDKEKVLQFVGETRIAAERPRKTWLEEKRHTIPLKDLPDVPAGAWEAFKSAILTDEKDIAAQADLLSMVSNEKEFTAKKLFQNHYDWFIWKMP